MLRFRRTDRTTASADPLGAVMLSGEYGGRTYVVRHGSAVRADDGALRQLAIDLDGTFKWSLADATVVEWGITNPQSEWAGSPEVSPGFWLDPRLTLRGVTPPAVDAVLSGVVSRLNRAG